MAAATGAPTTGAAGELPFERGIKLISFEAARIDRFLLHLTVAAFMGFAQATYPGPSAREQIRQINNKCCFNN